ncbi:PAS domain S-box protein [Mariprofundus sp. EBB-1]|uniref:CHASE domain-containing protein n=1 Tax=Mariprofundus sp. EBB-1 TaxID=2650971 RepID=UPI000EF2279A|nr:CHASE domain-containing protein [Mariprofundus sp. EBB-1]RLL51714.1 PAS domain S-box protein [Mariprofundus sp. EBB-1]
MGIEKGARLSIASDLNNITSQKALIATLLVTVLVSGSIFYLWFFLQEQQEQRLQSEFKTDITEVKTKIAERMTSYGQILKGGRSLFLGSQNVTRQEWHEYVSNLELNKDYPGIQGVGYSITIHPASIAAHEKEINSEGFDNYHIWPEGKRDLYSGIVYLEPFDWRNQRAFGYDMFSEPVRHEAMARARDSGTLALTGKVLLVQETREEPQAGSLLYVALYQKDNSLETVQQRRQALIGWIYSPYRMNDLIEGMLGRHINDFRLRIYDQSVTNSEDLLYDSFPAQEEADTPLIQRDLHLQAWGRTWRLNFEAMPSYAHSIGIYSPHEEVAGALLIGLLLIVLTWNLFNTQRKAELLARNLTFSLSKREGQLRFITDHAPVLIAQCDGDKRYKFVNQSYAEIFGLDPADLIGKHAREILGAEAFVEACPHMDTALSGQPSVYDLVLRPASENLLVVSVHYSPELDEFGHVIGFIAAIVDITKRRQAEDQMRELNARLINVFETMSDGFVSFDAEMNYTYVNANGGEILGRNPEDLIGKNYWQEYPEAKGTPFANAYESSLATQNPVIFEDHYEPFDRWFENRIYPFESGLSVFFTDITERKQSEIELVKYRDHLEALVDNRTHELAEANEHLQELDKLKSMFIASMSHELRTPMNSILGFTDLILQGLSGEINELQRDQLRRVHGAGKHLLLLISDIIDLSKVEAGKIEATGQDFELHGLLDEAMQGNLIAARKKNISIVLNSPTPTILMSTDRQRLLQCLLNLLSNAVKYSVQGTITLTTEQLGEEVIIEVRDVGIGMSGDEVSKLFQPFVRFDSELTIKAGGTGLGLYLTKKLMTEVLAGSISVDSQPGIGSCFKLRLPRRLIDEKNRGISGGKA